MPWPLVFGQAPQTTSTGETQIKQEVADAFNVNESDVTLTSPDLVLVQLTASSSEQGTASFKPCGTDCTKVKIIFPSVTLNFIVEDEVQGL